MYASITTVAVQPDQSAEATRIWHEEILPVNRTLKGWQGAELFTNPATGEGVAVNFYATEADLNAVESSGAFQALMALLGPIMAAPPVRKVYELTGQARQSGT
jgi:quinol monooxygenase YgiN